MLVEVCANSLESAVNAEKAGAHRIELCSELAVGGITPSFGMVKAVVEQLSIPIHVLIRPRSGNFTYSPDELEIMLTDIACVKKLGVAGIVTGALGKDFTIDVNGFNKLKAASEGLTLTFHRAFDWVNQPRDAFKLLDAIGVDYVLTSGQQPRAVDGIELLKDLNEMDLRLQVMPGSGINNSNACLFKENAFKAIHLSGTSMERRLTTNSNISMNSSSFLSDDHIAVTQQQTISQVVATVK